VLDPPKLIGSRAETDEGRKKYLDLNTLAMGLVEPGGLLLTCSCSGLLPSEEFLGIVRSAGRRAGRSARVLAVTGAAADHPVGLEGPEGGYVKAAWARMGEKLARPGEGGWGPARAASGPRRPRGSRSSPPVG